jgi:hypothetical protein
MYLTDAAFNSPRNLRKARPMTLVTSPRPPRKETISPVHNGLSSKSKVPVAAGSQKLNQHWDLWIEQVIVVVHPIYVM